jgi:hypothetical protein
MINNFNKFVREKIQVDYFEKNPDFYLSKNKKEIEEEREEQKEFQISIEKYANKLKKLDINDIKFEFNDGEYKAVSPSFLTPNFAFYKTHIDDGFTFRTNKHTEYNYKIILSFIKYLKKPTLSIQGFSKDIINPLFKELDEYYAAFILSWSPILFLTKDVKVYKDEIKEQKKNQSKILYTNYKTKGKELTDYETIQINKLRNKLKNISYEDISFKPDEDDRYYKVLINGEILHGITFIKEGKMGSNKVYFGHLKNRFHVSGGLREELKGIGLGYKIYKAFLKYNGYFVSDEQTSTGARKMYYNLLKDDDVLHVIDREVEEKGNIYGIDTEKVLLVWKDHPKLEKLMRIVRKHELKNNRKYKYDKELLKYIEDVKL